METKNEIALLLETIEYLKNNPQVNFDPYPQYDSRIIQLLGLIPNLDTDYLVNYEKVKDKEIREMTMEDLTTMFTFIIRGERFCDGHIASFIENGTLLKLAQRELVLLSKE